MPNEPKPLNKSDLGKVKENTTKGGHAGGENKYNQMKLGKGFMVHDPRPGHSHKKNIEEYPRH